MSTTYTSNLKLGKPAVADRSWNTPLNANTDALDALSPLAYFAVSTYEVPSTSLTIRIGSGYYLTTWGNRASYAGGTTTVSASTTTYVYLDSAGAIQKSASSFPTSDAHIPLAVVASGTSTITSITDSRPCYRMITPGTQPTMGSATASGTYGSTEQTMLQHVYDAVRAAGLGD